MWSFTFVLIESQLSGFSPSIQPLLTEAVGLDYVLSGTANLPGFALSVN